MPQNDVDAEREAAIWFRRRADRAVALTKLGGLPTLPNEIAWPRQRQTNSPLHFLAQVDLSRLPSTPLRGVSDAPALPKSGLLFFFADMVEEMLWEDNGGPLATTRVIFADHAGPERKPPDNIPEILHAFGERAGGYDTGMSVYPHAALESHVIDTFAGFQKHVRLADEPATAIQAAMIASIEKAIGPLPVFAGRGRFEAREAANPREYVEESDYQSGASRELSCPLHQMLGIGKDIQGTADFIQADGTILLLQIDSDHAVHEHFVFCDMGVAQFWIEPDDLAKRRFDKAWASTAGA